jgi:hypothetical protein
MIVPTLVAPSMKELASVSAIGPRRRNKPELMGLLHERVVFLCNLHRKHVERSKFVAVGVAIQSTWVRCDPHSRLLVRTVLDVLVRRHGVGAPFLHCWLLRCVLPKHCCVDFYSAWYIGLFSNL